MSLRLTKPMAMTALLAATITATSPALAIAAEGTITLAWEAEIRAIDPRFAVDANSQYLEHLLHCGLIKFDKDGQTTSDLAKDWTWTTPTSLDMTLRTDAKFSDGTPVTAADVKATYDFYKKELQKYASITVEDVRKSCREVIGNNSPLVMSIWNQHPHPTKAQGGKQ